MSHGPADKPRVEGEAVRGAADQLRIERYPGERGPLLRCTGELTLLTAQQLQQELDRLIPLRHPVLTINLSGCTFIDVDGLMTLLDACRRMRQFGGQLALIAGGGIPSRLLQVLGLDWLLPVFPKEEVAELAFRGAGPRPLSPQNWEEARRQTLERWREIQDELKQNPEEALRKMTSHFALCELSTTQYEGHEELAESRCQFCPLFQALGARRGDLGCRSILDPILDAVQSGRIDAAQKIISSLVELVTVMPVPEGDSGRPVSIQLDAAA